MKREGIMKRLLAIAAICLASLGFDYRYASAVDTCYKVEFEEEIYSFEAPETGTYTFNGGSVGTSPNGYLITVDLKAGDVWIVPPVGEVPGAAISNVIICPDDVPNCIYKDPATIRYNDPDSTKPDSFKMRGRLYPVVPLDFSEGLTGSLWGSPWELVSFTVAPEDIEVTSSRVRGRTGDTYFRMKITKSGRYGVFLRHRGDIKFTADPNIFFDLEIGGQWFQVTGEWTKRKRGWFLSNRNHVCAEY